MDSDILKFFGVMLALAVAGGVVYTLIALGHTLAQRLALRKDDASPKMRGRIEAAEARIGALEAMEARLAELEERVDFAERMLARQREPDRLPPGAR